MSEAQKLWCKCATQYGSKNVTYFCHPKEGFQCRKPNPFALSNKVAASNRRIAELETALAESRAERDKHIVANAENMAAMYKAERDEARAECERLREENFTLAAGACLCVKGDEHGNAYCEMKRRAEAAETSKREAYERAAKVVKNKMTFRSVKNSDGEVIDIPHESNKLLAECERLIRALAGERREG